jgi:cyclopropane fatty-acyl-phospholipid synthase-like methyltransferase
MRRTCCEEQRVIERFKERYEHAGKTAELAVERAAIGANVGCNGYTTIAQADELARRLRLGRGMRLLDIGCGRGYPGLYLAGASGCEVVSSDLPMASLRAASERASREQLSRRTTVVAASAVHLPLRAATFDAVVHADVLCCLRAKLSMLRACYDVLKPGGRMAFTTIYAAAGASERDYRRACRVRGCGFAERRGMDDLLQSAGFVAVTERDVSREFARTTRTYFDVSARLEVQLREEWGDAKFEDRQRDRRDTLAFIEAGVVRRGMFTARKPA